jgi:hypothetical protein
VRRVTRQIEDLGTNLHDQWKKKQSFIYYTLALDEINDLSEAAELLIFIHGTDDKFFFLKNLHPF